MGSLSLIETMHSELSQYHMLLAVLAVEHAVREECSPTSHGARTATALALPHECGAPVVAARFDYTYT
jgi:hypothetical protein